MIAMVTRTVTKEPTTTHVSEDVLLSEEEDEGDGEEFGTAVDENDDGFILKDMRIFCLFTFIFKTLLLIFQRRRNVRSEWYSKYDVTNRPLFPLWAVEIVRRKKKRTEKIVEPSPLIQHTFLLKPPLLATTSLHGLFDDQGKPVELETTED